MTTTHHPEHLLDRAAMVAMRLLLRPAKGTVNGPGARKAFDEIVEKVASASGVAYEAGTIGGVSGWWCRPENAVKGATILYLHGGGYVVGVAEAYQHFVGQIATRARVAAFVPDYRLAPEFPFPAAVEDAHAVYAGLVAEGLTNIALAGDSAGGGLALIFLRRQPPRRAEADPLSTPASLSAMARLYLGDRDACDPLASPLYGELTGLPPVSMHVGEDDVLLDDSVRYGERLEQQDGTIQVHTWRGMIHVFPSNVALLKAAKEALDNIGDFLRLQLLGEPAAVTAA